MELLAEAPLLVRLDPRFKCRLGLGSKAALNHLSLLARLVQPPPRRLRLFDSKK